MGVKPERVVPLLLSLHGPDTWDDLIFPENADLSHIQCPWLAFMVTRQRPVWHAVVIDRFDDNHEIHVRDPQDGAAYRMTLQNFLEAWSGYAVFRPQTLS